MTLKQAIKKANACSNKGFPFSELKYWKLIYEKTGKAYHQFRYADALRLCGFSKESEKIYISVPIHGIPEEHRYLYYSYLGHLYDEMGDFNKALSSYLKSFQLKSGDTSIYVFIAAILKKQDKDVEAIKYLEEALKMKGDIDEVNYNLATSYIRLGQLEDALQAINSCLMIDPKFPNAKKK
jgi:tetratricopeptide (TPR) repeat protein